MARAPNHNVYPSRQASVSTATAKSDARQALLDDLKIIGSIGLILMVILGFVLESIFLEVFEINYSNYAGVEDYFEAAIKYGVFLVSTSILLILAIISLIFTNLLISVSYQSIVAIMLRLMFLAFVPIWWVFVGLERFKELVNSLFRRFDRLRRDGERVSKDDGRVSKIVRD
jgi:hypothetical protein